MLVKNRLVIYAPLLAINFWEEITGRELESNGAIILPNKIISDIVWAQENVDAMTMSARSWWPSSATPKQLVTGCHALHGGTQNDYVWSNNVLVQKMSPFPLKDMKIQVGTNMTSFTPNCAMDMQPIIGKASWKSRTFKSRAQKVRQD